MANVPLWNGSSSYITGSGMTPFALYETDATFVSDAPKVADFCARKLGYPLIEVELQSGSMFTCFEESITEYSAQVNQFLIRENMLSMQGSPTSSTFTGRQIIPNMGRIIKLSRQYGAEAGTNPPYTIKTGSIMLNVGQTEYDLNALWGSVSESGASIEIRKIFHDNAPAIARYFDPFAGTGMGTYSMMQEFGFTGMSTGVSFLLIPMYADLLRIQAIEFNDMIRRSGYSFRLSDNKLKVSPIPTVAYKLYFEYIVVSDRDDILSGGGYSASGSSGTGIVTDYSNVPYQNITYNLINDVGKQWVRQYTLALAKELLGNIRGKYTTIPIPDSELALDGLTLRTEGQAERKNLIEQLRENLDKGSRESQLEKEKNEAEYLRDRLKYVPLKIYVG